MVDTLELPLDIIQVSSGFSIDIGGSVIKLVYRSKEDFENGVPRNEEQTTSGKGYLHLSLFAKGKINEVIDFIAENCDLTVDDEGKCIVYCTGIGGNNSKTLFEERLNVTLCIRAEFACLAAALCLLLRELPRDQLFRPVCEKGLEEGRTLSDTYRRMFSTDTLTSQNKMKYNYKELEDYKLKDDQHFPCILVTCGSVFAPMRVEEDGSCEFLDSTRLAGQFFYGLSSLILGHSDFGVLSDMVAESTGRSVDTYVDDIVDTTDEDNVLAKYSSSIRMFAFGKGLTDDRDKATKGDMVHSLLETMCESTAQTMYHHAQTQGVPRLYFCGNFINTPKAQQFLTRYLHLQQHRKGLQVNFEFIKPGGHLAALGAFLESHNVHKSKLNGE